MVTEAFERKDITLNPEWPWIIFGNGYYARIVSMMPCKNMEGEDVWKISILPGEELARRENITTDELDSNMTITMDYPISMVVELSHDPALRTYFCFLNFRGEECPETNLWQGKINADALEGLRTRMGMLKAANAALKERLWIAETNIQEYIKTYISEPASRLSAQYMKEAGVQPMPPMGAE